MPDQTPTHVDTDAPDRARRRARALYWPKLGPYPTEVKETLRVLGEILGAPRRKKRSKGAASWSSRRLGVKKSAMSEVKRSLSDSRLLLHGHVLAQWMHDHDGAVKILGPNGSAPEWRPLSLGEEHTVSVPFHLTAFFPAGTLRPEAVSIHICGGQPADITVYAGPDQREVAEAVLDEFLTALKGDANPYRGRILQVSASYNAQVAFEPMTGTTETRADLVLPPEVWGEIDLFLSTGSTRREDLLSLGLSTTRGLLLAGRPGVGKTKLGRILAAEVAGAMTVMVVEPDVLSQASENLYKEIEWLGPTLVVMEDIDAIAHKGKRSSSGFSEFLNALDGARVRNDVLTLATSNDPGALDAAVKRPGRFDTILEVPLPGQAGRTEILRLYLPRHGEDLDLAAIADTLDGATGAEIREVARRAVLEHGIDGMTTRRLLDITSTGRWKPAPAVGHYL